MTDNERKKTSFSSVLFYIYLVGVIALILFGPRPYYRKCIRSSGRQKACYSNIRVLQGAVEMYNMDVEPMMTSLNQGVLREGRYLKADSDLKCPETSKGATYSGDDLTEKGEIICSYHGGLIAEGPFDDENKPNLKNSINDYLNECLEKTPYALAWPALLALIGYQEITHR